MLNVEGNELLDDVDCQRRYFVVFIRIFEDFCIPELYSVLQIYKISIKLLRTSVLDVDKKNFPLLFFSSSEEVQKLSSAISRCVGIRYFGRVLAVGNFSDIHIKINHFLLDSFAESLMKPKFDSQPVNIRVKPCVFTQSTTQNLSDHKKIILEKILSSDFQNCRAKLKDPDILFLALAELKENIKYETIPDSMLLENYMIYFSYLISKGAKKLKKIYSLKTRKYIGNTSMDPTLAFFMSNLAQVDNESIVLDPFAGTGGILLSAAHFGAKVIGCEYNYTLISGRGKSSRHTKTFRARDESFAINFENHHLEDKFCGVIGWDSFNSGFRKEILFDAIITDPPYGIREKIKSNSVSSSPSAADERKESSVNENDSKRLSFVIGKLFEISFLHLKINGFLVFWYPLTKKSWNELGDSAFPRSKSFKLFYALKQSLNSFNERFLLVYQKISNANNPEEGLEILDKEVIDPVNNFRKEYFSSKR